MHTIPFVLNSLTKRKISLLYVKSNTLNTHQTYNEQLGNFTVRRVRYKYEKNNNSFINR